MRNSVYIILLISLLMQSNAILGQDSLVPQKDIIDVLFAKKKLKKPAVADSLVIKKLYPSYLPIIGYNPALGMVFGVGVSAGMLTGNKKTTHVSSALANVSVTTKKQINFNARATVYLPNDEWILQSDFRFLIFSQPTYGLGINFMNGQDGLEGAQPMSFNYLRLYQNVYKRIVGRWYAGIGINYDGHTAIEDKNLDTVLPGIIKTSHYTYSVANNLPINKYHTMGITFNGLYDNRDNAVNPMNGSFAQLSFRLNPEFLSTKASSSLYYEYRTYFALRKTVQQQHTIALWTWGQFQTSGTLPYLALPSITWDMYNRSGRGYIQGRLRGENFWYGEAAYRMPLTANGLFGAVAFFNLSTASNQLYKQKLGDDFAPGYGFGFRIKMDKKTNTNITIDYGIGRNGNSGIYFNLQEAF